MPKAWEVRRMRCVMSHGKMKHEYIAHRDVWVCLTCGTEWMSDEEREKRKAAARKLTVEDVWGGD